MTGRIITKHQIITIIISIYFYVLGAGSLAFADEPTELEKSRIVRERILELETTISEFQEKLESQNQIIQETRILQQAQSDSILELRNYENKQEQLLLAIGNNSSPVTDWLMVGVSIALLWLSILVWRINRQIARFTGAMESHSTFMLALEAKKNEQVTLKWWDPYFNGPDKEWPSEAQHGKNIELNEIYIGIPLDRRKKYSCRVRIIAWGRKVLSRIARSKQVGLNASEVQREEQ